MQRRYFFQRVSAAFFAISLRRDEVSVLARAAPPAFPRTRPDFVLDFPRRNPHDVNGVADRVGRALLALGASGH
jgi:hypothetical protein